MIEWQIDALGIGVGLALLCAGYGLGRLLSIQPRDTKGKFRKR